MDATILTVGAATALVLEVFKWLLRLISGWTGKVIDDFPPLFYVIATPVVSALLPFALIWLGVAVQGPLPPSDPQLLVKYLIVLVLESVISVGTYTVGINPLKQYQRSFTAKKKAELAAPVNVE
jgi:hypothetical protein